MDAADEAKLQAWDRLAHALRAANGGATPLMDALLYPGNGRPERANDDSRMNPSDNWGWHRLAKDSPLGQKQVVIYDAETDELPAPVQILTLNGTDRDATQVQLTLGSPLVVPKDFAEIAGANAQTLTGEFDNDAMDQWPGNFPGTSGPITWPPLVYVIIWGIGGARTKMIADAVNGARVNLTCSYLEVWAAIAPDAVNQPGTSGAYVLSAFVGPGWPTPTANAQRTIYVGTLDAAGDASAILPVPPHAKLATIIGAAPPPAMPAPQIPPLTVAYLRFFQDPAGAFPVGNFIVNGNQPIAFPIPNAGLYFSVVSGLGVAASFAALFELAA